MTINLSAFASSKTTQLSAVAIVSAGISAVATYLVVKKRLDEEYRRIVDTEIIEARRYYAKLNKRDEFATPDLVMKEVGLTEAIVALHTYQGEEPIVADIVRTIDKPTNMRVDYSNPDRRNQVIETPVRDRNVPYVISHDEFTEGTNENISVTYYVKDEILADDRDEALDEIEKTVGRDNLNRFGERSDDPQIVYVRNERLGVDFEVVRSDGSFAEIVHGISPGDHE